ncbi:tetratricopeptide repeat protein [Salinispira pacifica]
MKARGIARPISTVVMPAAALLLLVGCMSTQTKDPRGFDVAPLFGMIYGYDNQPVPGVEITVDGKAGPESDLMGRFVFPDLERGAHSIVATKQCYETISVPLKFLNQTQVLYLQMYSQSQLLDLAEKRIQAREWARARDLLSRAASVDPQDPACRFVRAILDFKTGRIDDAVSGLRSLLDSGVAEPAVYLFLADIYQDRLHEPAQAAALLEQYLERKGSAEIERRLRGLTHGD